MALLHGALRLRPEPREADRAGGATALFVRDKRDTGELLRVRDPETIRSAVAPPGGATEAGLKALERGGLEATLADAVRASLERFR